MNGAAQQRSTPASAPDNRQAVVLPFPSRPSLQDPLALIQQSPPSDRSRVVLWTVCLLAGVIMVWAAVGQLDIIAGAEGKLVPQTLLKVVQPAEAGVITQLLVKEGDTVAAGQVLARLDGTLAGAERKAAASDLALQLLQIRRVEAELAQRDLAPRAAEDMARFLQVQGQWLAHRRVYQDNLRQQQAQLEKSGHDLHSAEQILAKQEQALPAYRKVADAYRRLEGDGYMGTLATGEKQREALEKAKDVEAQRSMVASLTAAVASERNKLRQIESGYRGELERELAELRARVQQLQPALDKSVYREGLTELRAPQAGIVKDIATTTVGAVVQPGSVILTIVPRNELLYADVQIKNEDVGFVKPGQPAHLKVASYPFQRYGMLTGKVAYVSADASDVPRSASQTTDPAQEASVGSYKARIIIDGQILHSPDGTAHAITPGMKVLAEINQGRRTVLEYLFSPLQRMAQEAGHER